jgi:uncharacterized pyridoxamine 5'-phosphate oxidase family protein
MTRQELNDFVNANLFAQLATVDQGRPRVRTMHVFRADAQGILFHTGVAKSLHAQLLADPRVELCFTSADRGRQVRVAGRAMKVEDDALWQQVLGARRYLRHMLVEGEPRGGLALFRVLDLEVADWSMTANREEARFVKI